MIAIVSAVAILVSQFTASARFALTADKIIDSTQIGQAGMLSGFSVDSKNYSNEPLATWYPEAKYGTYFGHLDWYSNRESKSWNAEDSMNIYPIGTPVTNYAGITSEATFFAEPYAQSYVGTDLQIWDGYMFIVLQKKTWTQEEYIEWDGSTQIRNVQLVDIDSVIQVYDVFDGGKQHVATWTAEDLGIVSNVEGVICGIREIEVTDDNIFVLADIGGENWTHKYEWNGAPINTAGSGLAILDNNISRADGVFELPTRSALQPVGDENSDVAKYGVDVQPGLNASDSLNNGAKFEVHGDYLIYLPSVKNAFLTKLRSGYDWMSRDYGAYWVKWNEERTAGQKVEFTGTTIAEWIPFPTFPEDYKGLEAHNAAQYPQLADLKIDGDVMYADIAYTKPNGEGGYHQYDELFIVDISNPEEPTIIGKTAPIPSPTATNFTDRVMNIDENYVYISQKHYHHFDGGVDPYIYIIDKQDKANPVVVNQFALRPYMENKSAKGAEALVTVGDYMIIQAMHWTVFLEMSADRKEIVDSVAKEYMMAISDTAGGVHGEFIYGNRIFYPSLHGTTTKDGWRFDSRIEVIDFSAAKPVGFFVDDIANNGDGTYTISGTVEGIEVTPALNGLIAIGVTNTATKQAVGEIYFEELEAGVDLEDDIFGWSFTTNASTPANITFTLNDENGRAIADVYEEVSLGTGGGVVEPDPTPAPTPTVIPDTGLMADDVSVFVDFAKDYPDYVNDFTVWGEYTGTEEDEMQILTAVYDNTGKMLYAQLGKTVELIPGESFVVEDCILLDDGEIENTVLKVFVWNSAGAIRPLSRAFQTSTTTFSYKLDSPARTSAGVFDDEGNLIRTLWSGVEEDAGTYTKTWDGRDDNGVLQSNGKYNITVMENNVKVEVDAFIGNTSDHSNYDYIISGYKDYLSDMMYVDGKMFYIYPYSEGRQAVYYFNTSNPDQKAGEFGGTYRCMQRAVTDGQRMYVINTEKGMDQVFRTFVYAYDLTTRQMYMFEDQGRWVSSWGIDNHYYAVNVITHDQSVFQTGGMGVQTYGDKLFVSYVGEGKVYVLNKTTGALISSQSFNTPRALAYNDNGGLWIGYKQDNGRYIAERYNVANNGTLTKDTSISLEHDFGYLEYLELSPDGKCIVAADGSTNQYKMYSTETGKLLWTYGSGASYEDDPSIYPDKLMLKYTGNETDMVYAEFENNNTLWIGDVGNNRSYKLDISNGQPVVVDEIMMQPGSHNLGVDVTNPTTIYSNAIQYTMDYQASGADCWTPVKNWKKQVEKYNLGIAALNQFNNFITLPNGRTYFSAWRDDANRLFYFEGNDVYYTGIYFNDMVVLDDGRFGSVRDEGGRAIYRTHTVSGYNEAGDPIFDEGTIVANLPIDWTEPGHIFGATKINMPISENNVMITLRSIQTTDVNDRKTWHLGGVQLGDTPATDWTWRAAPEGSEFYDGNFPTDGTFEAGNGVLNSAQKVVTSGANVVFEYNGEFYRQLQTNKLYFYRDNGLLVGMFGEATRQRLDYEDRHLYGKEIYPGNAFDMYFIQDPGDSDRAYILQNNENGFGNFKYNVTGLDSIREHNIKVDLNVELWDGLTYRYYAGDSTDPANLVTREWRATVSKEDFNANDAFEMHYTGYIQNPNSSDTLKLYINTKETMVITIGGQEVFNGTDYATPEIYLEAGKLYPFSCVVKKGSSTTGPQTRVVLGYYDTKNTRILFTEQDFKTEKLPYTASNVVKRDLLEGLPFASAIANGTYGITRDTAIDVGGISVNTNSSNASFDAPRDIRFQSNLWPHEDGWWPTSAWMAKSLGTPRDNLNKWELEMDVARTNYLNYGNLGVREESTGVVIEVLDVNDKVIANFYWAMENKAYGNNIELYQASNITNNNLNHELYAVPGEYHNDFNTPSTLRIRGENGSITFEYHGGKVVAEVLDPEAQWDKPLKVKLDAFFNYDQTQAREMGTSITRMDYTQYLAEY